MLHLRAATREDVPVILAFVRELAAYERLPDEVVATEEDFLRDGFGPQPRFHALVADWDGEPAGFALWFYNWSTWTGRSGIYLEDLYVRPLLRRHGIGKALLRELARIALDQGCRRLVWQVLDWNEPALDFYRSLGAKVMPEWVTVRVEGEALAALAERAASPRRAEPEARSLRRR
jgi:GNAT superfamily N-acetyltransferase